MFSLQGNEATIFKNLGVLEAPSEEDNIRYRGNYQLKPNKSGNYEATFVFSVSVESNFSIGINSHNILDDFDLLLYNHTSNELITSTSESYSGYSNIEGMLNTRDTYRLKIIGSKHEKDRAGKFYINQKSTQS